MEKLPERARITDEITGVIYVLRCERELSPQEIQRSIVEHKEKMAPSLRSMSRGRTVEIRVRAA